MSKSLSTVLFSATLLAAALGAVAMPAAAQSASTSHPVVTRAQVLADLQIYRESGLAEADRPEGLSFENGRRAQAQARPPLASRGQRDEPDDRGRPIELVLVRVG